MGRGMIIETATRAAPVEERGMSRKSGAPVTLAPRRVLVVEDEGDLARVVKRHVEDIGCLVRIAPSGESALEAAANQEFDLVLLDVMLPGIDGLEVCRRLRARQQYMPVLMLTARSSEIDKVLGLETGADDYLIKPFDFNEFVARVRALLRRPRRYEAPLLQVGDLTINTNARTVRRRDRDILLTSKEFALLEFLARNAGRVVGRTEISEHVWDNSYDAFSNVIDVFIRRLRRKIDEGEDRRLLHTRRGAGYVLSADPAISLRADETGDD